LLFSRGWASLALASQSDAKQALTVRQLIRELKRLDRQERKLFGRGSQRIMDAMVTIGDDHAPVASVDVRAWSPRRLTIQVNR
jgi:hypothetical protein